MIAESSAMYDGAAADRQEPGVSVPSLALHKVPSLHGKASGNTAAISRMMSQTSKPDSEAEAPPVLGELSPRSDQLTSEQVAALEGEAPLLLEQDPGLMQLHRHVAVNKVYSSEGSKSTIKLLFKQLLVADTGDHGSTPQPASVKSDASIADNVCF